MHAIRTTQTIVHREALARDEAMAEVVSKLRCIVRMDGLYDRFQAAHAWLVHIRYIQAEEIHHALAEENRLSVRSQSPEVARNDVYKLRELPLPLVQRLLGLLALRDIDKADQTLVGRSEDHTAELQSLM